MYVKLPKKQWGHELALKKTHQKRQKKRQKLAFIAVISA